MNLAFVVCIYHLWHMVDDSYGMIRMIHREQTHEIHICISKDVTCRWMQGDTPALIGGAFAPIWPCLLGGCAMALASKMEATEPFRELVVAAAFPSRKMQSTSDQPCWPPSDSPSLVDSPPLIFLSSFGPRYLQNERVSCIGCRIYWDEGWVQCKAHIQATGWGYKVVWWWLQSLAQSTEFEVMEVGKLWVSLALRYGLF